MDNYLLRRRKIFRPTPELIVSMLTALRPQGNQFPVCDFPADGIESSVRWDPESNYFEIVIHSATFDEVQEGEPIPELRLQFKMVDRGVTSAQAAAFFEEVRKLDPAVIDTMFNIRRQCNQAVLDHPTIPVVTGASNWVTFLGLLNGMLVAAGQRDRVCKIVDDRDQQNIMQFGVVDSEGKTSTAQSII